MILLLAIVVGGLFGAGAFLLLDRDLVRMTAGVLLMSQSANLLLMSAGLLRGEAPILPLPGPEAASDPLTQALTLTAVVISFGVAALLLALVLRVHEGHGTIDVVDVVEAEKEEEREPELAELEQEREEVPVEIGARRSRGREGRDSRRRGLDPGALGPEGASR